MPLKVKKTLKPLVDTIRVRKGIYTIRKAFFGDPPDDYRYYDLEDLVLEYFPTAIIIDSGMLWKPYRPKARLCKQSHWWVEFNFKEEK